MSQQQIVYIFNEPVRPIDLKPIAAGGEGSVYLYIFGNRPLAVKIYHGWNSLGRANLNDIEKMHLERLWVLQKKLKEIPTKMPNIVVKPIGFVFDQTQRIIVGSIMPYIDGHALDTLATETSVRQEFTMQEITDVLLKAHRIISDCHQADIIQGDTTADNNMLEKVGKYYRCRAVDFESMQWGNYLSTGFQWDYVDPLLLEPNGTGGSVLKHPYTKASDWYSFTAITMQVLTRCGPYTGEIKFDAVKRWKGLSDEMRPLKRLNVFHPDVMYPRYALPLDHLPTELVDLWRETFVKNHRDVFPPQLLMQLTWRTCPRHTVYATKKCPKC